MHELGDDLGLLARMERDLMQAWKPQDSMQASIVADPAKLYWKKTQLERTLMANRPSEMRRVNQAIALHNAHEKAVTIPLARCRWNSAATAAPAIPARLIKKA